MAGWLTTIRRCSVECNDRQAIAYMAVCVTPDRAWTFCCSPQQSLHLPALSQALCCIKAPSTSHQTCDALSGQTGDKHPMCV